MSPESVKIKAKPGYGLMLIAQKPWAPREIEETGEYRELFRKINGHEPPQPVLSSIAFLADLQRDGRVERCYRDARLYRIDEGMSEIQKLVCGRADTDCPVYPPV